MTLTKADLIKSVRSRSAASRNGARSLINSLLEGIKRTLESGQDITISRFGKFQVKERKTRLGINPSAGNSMPLEARRVVTFRCSGVLKKKLNNDAKHNPTDSTGS